MSTTKRIVIAGGAGFLGQALAGWLSRAGWGVTVLSRRGTAGGVAGAEVEVWDGRSVGAWARVLEGAAGVVNLAGRSVDCVKTPEHCDEILRSRVESTRALGEAIRRCARRPGVWVQMSTAHIYGDPPRVWCDEQAPTGYGLAPTVGRAWEEALGAGMEGLGEVRPVVLRTSFVVGRRNGGGAGALGRLGLLARLGLGGRVGCGEQGMSWLHEADFCRIVERGIENTSMRGVYNVTAPTPVSQVEFMRSLRRAAGGLGGLGIGLPSTEWMVRLGAGLVLRTDPELALYGRYVVPRRLLGEGFEFSYPTLEAALGAIYGR